jgi:hypothetical protein
MDGAAGDFADPPLDLLDRVAEDRPQVARAAAEALGADPALPVSVGRAHLRPGGTELFARLLDQVWLVVGHSAQEDQLEFSDAELLFARGHALTLPNVSRRPLADQ